MVFDVEELLSRLMDSVASRSKLLDDDRSIDDDDDGSFLAVASCVV